MTKDDNSIIWALILVALITLFLLIVPCKGQEPITCDPATAVLAWDPPAEGGPVDGYRLLYGALPGEFDGVFNGGLATSVPMAALTLTQGQTYHAVVVAFNAAGDSPYSNEVTFIPLGPPGAPSLRVE